MMIQQVVGGAEMGEINMMIEGRSVHGSAYRYLEGRALYVRAHLTEGPEINLPGPIVQLYCFHINVWNELCSVGVTTLKVNCQIG